MNFKGGLSMGELGLRVVLCPMVGNVIIRTACCSIGIGLPVYSTIKAIEDQNQREQERCLVYWTAYGSFSLAEVIADKLISRVPMYYHVKFAFLVWLQLDGATKFHTNHLRPLFLRHRDRIDRYISSTRVEIMKLVVAHQAEIEFVRSFLVKISGLGAKLGSSSLKHLCSAKSNSNGENGPTFTRDSGSESDHDH